MFNFISGTTLAEMQDTLMSKHINRQNVLEKEIKALENNLLVRIAEYIAPCNLVIRQYALIDVLRDSETYESQYECHITSLLLKIAADGVYAEGYSYWLYTKEFLKRFLEIYENHEIEAAINIIDRSFLFTAYTGADGHLWPAPFGDLREQPIEIDIQYVGWNVKDEVKIGIIEKMGARYTVSKRLLGFNLHCPSKKTVFYIVDGKPAHFQWYSGYKDKFPTFWSEIKEMCRLDRLISLFRI